MIFVTGDTHGVDFQRLNSRRFPIQKEMTKEDIVIICGDFGLVWDPAESPEEKNRLDWLDSRNFTTVFCDGNHENFTRLGAYPVVDFHGGKAHRIRDHVYHLMRGEIFDFEGKRFAVIGGAESHDVEDGILYPDDYPDEDALKAEIKRLNRQGKHHFRIAGRSWWAEEAPSQEELDHTCAKLAEAGWQVDYVITHCAPTSILPEIGVSPKEATKLTDFFDSLIRGRGLKFRHWYFGHYHDEKDVGKFSLLYTRVLQIK